ncbi:MAG: hypothetical protein ACK5SI_09960 [Planctomycetia bacterium]
MISQTASWKAAESVLSAKPAASAGPYWRQKSASSPARVAPSRELAASGLTSANELVPGATDCRPSMQNDLKAAGTPAAAASPVIADQPSCPT